MSVIKHTLTQIQAKLHYRLPPLFIMLCDKYICYMLCSLLNLLAVSNIWLVQFELPKMCIIFFIIEFN